MTIIFLITHSKDNIGMLAKIRLFIILQELLNQSNIFSSKRAIRTEFQPDILFHLNSK